MKNIDKKYAFTLAETLITLVIIGIVAALTIPNLIIKHQKEQTVTKLKKTYSTLQQAFNRAIVDNGPIKTWTYTTERDCRDANRYFLKTYLFPYVSLMKDCEYNTTSDCNFKATYISHNGSETLSNTWYRFYLSDGTFIAATFDIHGTFYLYVDINGQKKPNTYGRDIFCFYVEVLQNKFAPRGLPTNNWKNLLSEGTYNCNNKTNNRGYACSGVIVAAGWRIPDDYPW